MMEVDHLVKYELDANVHMVEHMKVADVDWRTEIVYGTWQTRVDVLQLPESKWIRWWAFLCLIHIIAWLLHSSTRSI